MLVDKDNHFAEENAWKQFFISSSQLQDMSLFLADYCAVWKFSPFMIGKSLADTYCYKRLIEASVRSWRNVLYLPTYAYDHTLIAISNLFYYCLKLSFFQIFIKYVFQLLINDNMIVLLSYHCWFLILFKSKSSRLMLSSKYNESDIFTFFYNRELFIATMIIV